VKVLETASTEGPERPTSPSLRESPNVLAPASPADVMRRIPTPARTTSRRASFRIVRTTDRHADSVARVIRRAHDVADDELCLSCPTPAMVRRQIRRFPEGQFVAVRGHGDDERVLGVAMLMRTDRPPSAKPKPWLRMIGGLGLRNHVPDGRWLYGVEIAVDPDAQGQGVGSALYRRRLELVRELGLEGMYAGGMLKGYRRFRSRMSPREYAERVRSGEIEDPTVTMQLRRGFRAAGVIEDYVDDEEAGNCAMLIVWRPQPDGSVVRRRIVGDGSERRVASRRPSTSAADVPGAATPASPAPAPAAPPTAPAASTVGRAASKRATAGAKARSEPGSAS